MKILKFKKFIIIITILIIILIITKFFKIDSNVNTATNKVSESILNNDTNTIQDIKKISNYNNPPVPDGFKKFETANASWTLENGIPKGWNNGLVIEDDKGNQFVWIPYLNGLTHYKAELSSSSSEDKLPTNITSETDQILKYGGFYIAKYEAGVSDDMQKTNTNISSQTNDVKGIPVSKKGVRPWNYISYENAKIDAETIYNNSNIQSGLITISQYDALINWISDTYYDIRSSINGTSNDDFFGFGNFSNDIYKNFSGLYSFDYGKSYELNDGSQKTGHGILLSTGACESYKINNIYDIFGNLSELTTYYKDDYRYVYGGDYQNLSNKNSFTKQYKGPCSWIGFRVVLYLK